MGFGYFNDEDQADNIHRVDLYNPKTGEPEITNGRKNFVIIRGGKSKEWVNSAERQTKIDSRKGKAAENRTTKENLKIVASRLAGIVVAAYIDVGNTEIDLIEFDDIEKLGESDRIAVRNRLANAFHQITDLLVMVNDEVHKDANFLPENAKTLSALLSSESGTEQPQTEASTPA